MKKIVEIEGAGLESLLGENVTIFCVNYIYAGKLSGVNDTCIELEDAKIVYETGPLKEPGFANAQSLPNVWYISRNAIESFGKMQ